jgi:hypothetical protein
MGTASTNKRVQRASGAKKVALRAKRRPYAFYAAIAAVVAAGGAGIAFSRGGGTDVNGESPGLQDHWHTAYAVDICGTIQPNMAQPTALIGLHTHSDGLIHVEPFVTGSALDRGSNATLARFAGGEPGLALSSTEVQVPGGKLMKNGDRCDGKPGKLTIRQWPNAAADAFTDSTDPSKVKITDGGAITIAFLPEGTTDIPKPTTIANLANPNAGEGGGTAPSS